MVYGLAVHSLWYAPVYAWMMLISAWARRTPFLWFAAPLFLILMLERMVGGRAFRLFLGYRFTGAIGLAFETRGVSGEPPAFERLSQLTPGNFLATPGLWVGLMAAAVFIVAAVKLRRQREPS